MIIESLAWFGALLSCLLSLPQLVQVLHSDQVAGVSASTYLLVLANAAVWGAWERSSPSSTPPECPPW